MTEKFYRLPAVIEATGNNRTQIYKGVKDGTFPKPVKLTPGGRAVAWLSSEISEWQQSRIEARKTQSA